MNCCPFASSGGLHGEDCTYFGKSHCPFRLAAEGLYLVNKSDVALLKACSEWKIIVTENSESGQYSTIYSDPLPIVRAELARRRMEMSDNVLTEAEKYCLLGGELRTVLPNPYAQKAIRLVEEQALELEERRKVDLQNCAKIDELKCQIQAVERKIQKVKDILASDGFPGQTLILIRDAVYK